MKLALAITLVLLTAACGSMSERRDSSATYGATGGASTSAERTAAARACMYASQPFCAETHPYVN
jgi:hypothetical protein